MGERLTCRVEVGGERLDVYLAQLDEVPSRAYAKRLIDDGHVTINGQSPGKAGVRLKAGDVVEVHLPPPQASELEPQAIPLDIVYEDAHLLVLNKPAGMVVHPAPGHSSGTLVNALLHRYPDLPGIGGVKRPGIVHRLDKETSGLMVVAKTTEALSALVRAMKARRITRRYLALVHGVVKADQGQIDAPIGRHPVKRQQMAVVEGGRPALTRFRVLERFAEATYLAAELVTGRTHQIRVHMAFIGHPVLGDERYGRKGGPGYPKGHALHAAELAFVHPLTSAPLRFEAPLPRPFADTLQRLRGDLENRESIY